jgi:prepilin-type N-terminal cleavage/methylation domain-containing protein
MIRVFSHRLQVSQKLRQGFTLIELLVATALLVLLTTVVIASFRQANITSRDAKRKADLHLIRGALEAYRLEQGTYPGTLNQLVSPNVISSLGLSPNYINEVLLDPLSSGTYAYRYTRRNLPGCPYELGALMESANNVQTCGACGSTPPAGNYYCVAN